MKPAMSEYTCLQLQNLYELAKGDKVFVLKMLRSFCDTVPGTLQLMRQNLNQGDRESLAQLAHRMKPAFMYVGVDHLVPILNTIEANSRSMTAEELGHLLAEVEQAGDVACKEAENEIRILES